MALTFRFFRARKDIPSGSHNASYSPEKGYYWPKGEVFMEVLEDDCWVNQQYRTQGFRALVQLGGEEVVVRVSIFDFNQLFESTEVHEIPAMHSLNPRKNEVV